MPVVGRCGGAVSESERRATLPRSRLAPHQATSSTAPATDMDGAATIPDRHDQASPSSLRPTTLHSASAQSATSTRRALLAGDARPDAVDLSHHLSDMAKSRLTSPLKVRSFPLDESSSAELPRPGSDAASSLPAVAVRLHAAAWDAPPRRRPSPRRALPFRASSLLPPLADDDDAAMTTS